MFGKVWCDIYGALDVFLCTSSIMNICLISLDRYWSITKAIQYLNQRTPNRVALMIVMVWVLSGNVDDGYTFLTKICLGVSLEVYFILIFMPAKLCAGFLELV